MFNRTRSPREATASIDTILADLQSPTSGTPAVATPPSPAPDPAAAAGPAPAGPAPTPDHAATLRATRDAEQQAREMLTMASHARTAATEQAEQIVLEAQGAAERMRSDAARDAERIRREAADWVATQRTRVDALITEATEAVDAEVEEIRAEALRSAMTEAEQTARLYVGEAASRGARDAEAIRAGAREVLDQARAAATDLQGLVRHLAEVLTRTAAADEKAVAIDRLLACVEVAEAPVALAPAPLAQDPLDPTVSWDDAERPGGTGDAAPGHALGAMFRGGAGVPAAGDATGA